MNTEETLLKQAERHVRAMAAHVARQRAIIDELRRDNHARALPLAEKVLHTMIETLRVATAHRDRLRQG